MGLFIWKRIIRAKYGVWLGSCILLQGSLMAVVSPFLPIVISDRIGLDKPGVTAFFVMNTLVGIAVTLVTGYLSDGVVARHKLVMVGGAVGALGYFGIAAATQPIHAFMAGPFTIAIAVLFPQVFAAAKAGVVGEWEREAQVMGITALRTLFSLGFILGTALASWLARVIDIQALFFVISGALMALTVYLAVILRQVEGYIARQAARSGGTRGDESPKTRGVILPLYALIVPLIALIVLQGAESTRHVYLPLVMFQLFHDASVAPLMFGISAAAELIALGLLGYLSSKIGEKLAISIGALVGALYFIILSFTQLLPVLYLANVLYAVFVAALFGVAMAYVQGLLYNRPGTGGSLYVAVLQAGSLVGILSPLLVTGYDQRIYVIPAILCVTGAALLMIGDRTAQIEKRLSEPKAREARSC